jgi:hypothetical protein
MGVTDDRPTAQGKKRANCVERFPRYGYPDLSGMPANSWNKLSEFLTNYENRR